MWALKQLDCFIYIIRTITTLSKNKKQFHCNIKNLQIFPYLPIKDLQWKILTQIWKYVGCRTRTCRIHQVNQSALVARERDTFIPHFCVPEKKLLQKKLKNYPKSYLLFPWVSCASISTLEPYWKTLPFGWSRADELPVDDKASTILFL